MRGTDSNILDVTGKKSKGMGRGRTPCCDRDHVNRGPWSPAEDLRLISFIQKYGHDNWRALPKQAGLLRCGKSCRLRWVNYLRPDLKRGNFTREEEETIFRLHQAFGNKWSKIAAHLPGRTDNEIKNVWNTHLKKKLAQTGSGEGINRESSVITSSSSSSSTVESNLNHQKTEIDSQVNMLPYFSVMKTGQMEFPKINYAPMVNEMSKLQDNIPFNDFGSMNHYSEQFLDSSGMNQLEDFTMWLDPNVLDSLLNVDADPNWGLPTPDIQLGPTYSNPSLELETEPDFDLWGMLSHDVVSAHANPDRKAKDKLPIFETSMIGKNMDTDNEYITDKDIDSLLESLETLPELSQISPGMRDDDVPNCSSAGTANVNGTKEMRDFDFFPMWPSSPI